MNERKANMRMCFKEREPYPLCPLYPQWAALWASHSEGRLMTNGFHSRARGPRNTCISSDIAHGLIFIFLGMLCSLLIKSQPFVTMEPNQT